MRDLPRARDILGARGGWRLGALGRGVRVRRVPWRGCSHGRARLGPAAGLEDEHLANRQPKIGSYVVPLRQVAIIEFVSPCNAVQRVLRTNHIRRERGGAGAGGASADHDAAEPSDGDRSRQAHGSLPLQS